MAKQNGLPCYAEMLAVMACLKARRLRITFSIVTFRVYISPAIFLMIERHLGAEQQFR